MRRLILLVGLAGLSACCHLTHMEPEPAPAVLKRESLAAGVERLVRPVLDAGETPGLVVGVATPDGGRHFFSYGVGEVGGGPLGPDSLFPVGSLTKGHVGALLGELVHEGVLRWDEPLATLLPGWQLPPRAAALTLEQLATHSAGLPRQPTRLAMLTGLLHFTLTGSNFYGVLDEAYLRDFMAGFEPPPHPTPAYSNIGYALIGLALEARTGQPLAELLATRLLRPLGLAHTGLPGQLDLSAHRAQGHAGDQPYFMPRGQAVADWQFPPAMQGSAALYASAADLLEFAVQHLRPEAGPLQQRLADHLRVRHPQPQDAPGIAWVTDDFEGIPITNQVGMAVGHTSYLGVHRDSRTAVVVLQTSFNWNFKIGHKLLLRLVRGQLLEDAPAGSLSSRPQLTPPPSS